MGFPKTIEGQIKWLLCNFGKAGGNQNLQQVTNNGPITTNIIQAAGVSIYDTDSETYKQVAVSVNGVFADANGNVTIAAGGNPADPIRSVQFNAGEGFGGSDNFIYDTAGNLLIGGTTLEGSQNSIAFGIMENDGSIATAGTGSQAFGYSGGGLIYAIGFGSQAFGSTHGGLIKANGDASLVFGSTDDDTSSQLTTEGEGSLAFGRIGQGGQLTANSTAALAFGQSYGPTAILSSTSDFGLTFGDADGGIINGGNCGLTFGYATDENSLIVNNNLGTLVFGRAGNNGALQTGGDAGLLFGWASDIDEDDVPSQILLYADTSLVFGRASGGGSIIRVQGPSSFAFGQATGPGSIINTNSDSTQVFGNVSDGGQILSNSTGALVFGTATGASVINAMGTASLLFGTTSTLGLLKTNASSSIVFGTVDGEDASIITNGNASLAFGSISGDNGGSISTLAEAALAFGYIQGNADGCVLKAGGRGSLAFGYLDTTGDGVETGGTEISATANGSFAGGYAGGGGTIKAGAIGASFAFGSVKHNGESPGFILSTGLGSIAIGNAENSWTLGSTGKGSFAGGFAHSGNITASAEGAFAFGYTLNDSIVASGLGAVAIGDEIIASHNLSYVFGRGISSNAANTMTIGFNSKVQLYIKEDQIGINTNTPNASAALDVVSTIGGLLVPRMTTVEMAAIAVPTNGLIIYVIDGVEGFYGYKAGAWTIF